jgi:protein-tyrosine phosphatase
MSPADPGRGVGGRKLRIPGMFNVRDLGGLPLQDGGTTRPGKLLRSAELSWLEPAGAAMLAEFGLRTVVDLRTRDEVDQRPDNLTGMDAALVSISFLALDYDEIPATQADLYTYMADSCTDQTAQVVKALAAPDALPGLFHCAVGKDRTGFIAGIILALIGVPDDEIIQDFLLSNPALGFPPQSGTAQSTVDHPVDSELVETPPMLSSRNPVSAELLAGVMDRIRARHGTIAAYLRAGGVTDQELESLTAALVDRG